MGNNWGFADDRYPDLRRAVQRLCADFPGPYWQQMDRTRAYPTAFVQAMTEAGFLAALIPEEYGGGGATILYQIAPVSNNLVLAYLAQHILGLPRSY